MPDQHALALPVVAIVSIVGMTFLMVVALSVLWVSYRKSQRNDLNHEEDDDGPPRTLRGPGLP